MICLSKEDEIKLCFIASLSNRHVVNKRIKIMSQEKDLYILWTNDNVITAENMVFMYLNFCMKNKKWKSVTLIIWGATVKLTAENDKIVELIHQAEANGVHVSACLGCATKLNLVGELQQLHIDMKYWGEYLTEIIDNENGNIKLITI